MIYNSLADKTLNKRRNRPERLQGGPPPCKTIKPAPKHENRKILSCNTLRNTEPPIMDGPAPQGHTSTPWSDIDLQDPDTTIQLFAAAATANVSSIHRQGSCDCLGSRGRILMTGDLHDHTANLFKMLKLSQLERDDTNHVVLHEMIHGPHRINGCDLSVRMLARVAATKNRYPDQVHLLHSNHELAQLMGQPISKDGVSVIGAFDEGVDFIYGHRADDVRAAAGRFIRSFALAVRCENGIFCSHSLPGPRRMDGFDPEVLDRDLCEADLVSGGSAHLMVWGRNHDDALAENLGNKWDADVFVIGHQPAEMGYTTEGQSILILASDHDHGVALPIDLAATYALDELVARLIPLASVTM